MNPGGRNKDSNENEKEFKGFIIWLASALDLDHRNRGKEKKHSPLL